MEPNGFHPMLSTYFRFFQVDPERNPGQEIPIEVHVEGVLDHTKLEFLRRPTRGGDRLRLAQEMAATVSHMDEFLVRKFGGKGIVLKAGL